MLARVAISAWLIGRQIEASAAHRARRRDGTSGTGGAASARENEQTGEYVRARMRLARSAEIAQAASLLLLTLGGGIAVIDAFWRQVVPAQPWLGAACLVTVFAVPRLVGLPFVACRIFVVEARFGFNRMSSRLFAADIGKRILLGAAIATPVAAAATALVEQAGRWWWLGASGGWIVTVGVSSWAWPLFVAPMFNRFAPLDDPALKSRIEKILHCCGFAPDGVFVMDGSRRSAHVNASLSGFGRRKRIVLLDTLLERLDAAEIEAVLAHELGHFRLRHMTRRFLVSAVLVSAGFAVLYHLAQRDELYTMLGLPLQSAHASLALAVVAAPLVSFFLMPFRAAWARRQEIEADDFAVRHVGAGPLASALTKIHKDNLADFEPDKLYAAVYATHPPPRQRIARCQACKAGKAV